MTDDTKDSLDAIEVITNDLNKIKKDLDSRIRLRDQLVGKRDTLLEKLVNDFKIPTVELAEKELSVCRLKIKTLFSECETKLVELKKKIKEFDEQSTKMGREQEGL